MDYLVTFIKNIRERGLEMLGRYYSEYPAFVYDREDPEHRGRLRLVIPMITRNRPMETWVLPKKFSGNGYGVQVLPKKGDVVWVTFRHGDKRHPLWEHGYEGKKDAKDEELQSYDNYWFKTPQGITGQFDDENREVRVYVPVTDNNTLKLIFNDTGISLVRDGKKISLGALDGSAEPAVLGDKNKDALDELALKIDNIYSAIGGAAVAANDGGATFKSNIIAALGTFPISFTFDANYSTPTKSENVTLD